MTNKTLHEKLLPCPFCGGEAKDITYGSCDCCNKAVNGGIGCAKCDCKIDHLDSSEDASKIWNTRTQVTGGQESKIPRALEIASDILLKFQSSEPANRPKIEEWEACYAMLFKQLNNPTNKSEECDGE